MPNEQMLGEEQNESRETSEIINVIHWVWCPMVGLHWRGGGAGETVPFSVRLPKLKGRVVQWEILLLTSYKHSTLYLNYLIENAGKRG